MYVHVFAVVPRGEAQELVLEPLHFAAAIANFSWLETRASPVEQYLGFDDSEIFLERPRLNGAVLPITSTPGLGITIDEKRLQHQAFEFWEAPHLRRRDGSITNW